ncbi:MAG: hypothetical protein QOG03_1773 [Actinomycetota bacterium]|jgi:hypothetical protein|nr:hypothetical protein [Actinomycetota bacterium]
MTSFIGSLLVRLHLRVRPPSAPESALLIPLPEVDGIIGHHRLRHDPSARNGVPAHVTLLYPFVSPAAIDDGVLTKVTDVVRDFRRFDVRFERVGRFGEVVYLAPEPGDPFAEMTAALVRAFPKYPPYRGRFTKVIPHLTVAEHSSPPDLGDALAAELPVAAACREVWLMTEADSGQWSTRERWTLL